MSIGRWRVHLGLCGGIRTEVPQEERVVNAELTDKGLHQHLAITLGVLLLKAGRHRKSKKAVCIKGDIGCNGRKIT